MLLIPQVNGGISLTTLKSLLTTIRLNDRFTNAVTKRKFSGASRSMEIFEHTANLLTVV